MTRRSRVPAGECTIPGWYVTRAGRVVQLVKQTNSRWVSQRCPLGFIPYRAPGNPKYRNPLWRVTSYGFLPADYLLLEVRKPRWA